MTGRSPSPRGTASKPGIMRPSALVEKNTGLTMARNIASDSIAFSMSTGEGGVSAFSRISGGGSESSLGKKPFRRRTAVRSTPASRSAAWLEPSKVSTEHAGIDFCRRSPSSFEGMSVSVSLMTARVLVVIASKTPSVLIIAHPSEMTERRCASVSRGTILAISPIAGSKYTSSSAAAVSPAAGSATLTPAISNVGVSANADKADSAEGPPLPRDLASAAATAAATDPCTTLTGSNNTGASAYGTPG
mmetsp:Transcript_23725/g.58811  ORF Transcript_23725/g.58811 Transcript_23725/m.58811 type:complete len:247 (-) Transcript_23725:1016-1756(-)